MDAVIGFANAVFQPLIDLGAAPMMTIVLTVIALLFKVKFTKALEGGLKLGIAITGIGAIINILTTAFSSAMTTFVESTGLQLTVTDVGWAPLATITWGSPVLPDGSRHRQHRDDRARQDQHHRRRHL